MATSGVHAPATMVLIGLNLLVFLWLATEGGSALSGSGAITQGQADLGLSKAILQGRTAFGDESIPGDQWYRLITSGFIHFGIFHILMNMLLLYQLGNLLERLLGSTRFVLLYFASLLVGSLGVLALDSGGLTGGASGAVFGLMAGAAIGLHRRGVNVFSTGIGTTLLLNLVLTFSLSGVSVGGHLGGAVGGAVCGFFMLAPTWRPQPRWVAVVAPLSVGLAAIVASVVIVG